MSTKSCILVEDVMLDITSFPVLSQQAILKDALSTMSSYSLGIACITDDITHELLGVLTDGDLRRRLLQVQKPFSAFLVDDAIKYSIRNPIKVTGKTSLFQAVQIMEDKRIWDLPVVNDAGTLNGLLHLHPAVNALLNNSFE